MSSQALRVKKLLLIGQCVAHKSQEATKVRVKLLEFDPHFNMYFGKHVNFYAHDPKKICKEGDIVLIKKLSEQFTKYITHDLVKVLYQFGDVTDPITGEKCVGKTYRKQMALEKEHYGVAEDGTGGFDYESAPPRGWQIGKKDFTNRIGYQKFHEFEPNHPMHNDPAAS